MLEPNGALRTVSYTADERGFNPIVSYSYGHPQSAVSVSSATGPASILKQPGVYAPAYVADNRVQIVDKSNIYAAPPPAINFQAFSLPGPSTPVVVPAPLRQVAPVVKASAAIATNYAPAFVPSHAAYLPPPQPQVLTVAAPPPPPPQVIVRQQQFVSLPQPQPQVFAVPQPQVYVQQQPAIAVSKVVQPAKYLTVPTAKVVKTAAVAVVKDSYSVPPRNTFRDPNAPSYPDSVKISEPVADYGPPSYVPPPPLAEVTPVKVVQPVVQKVVAAPPPQVLYQKVVAAPQPQVAYQKVVAAPPPQVAVNPGLYASAIGYHTLTNNPDSYVHAYGTQGFQVTSSRKFNKGFLQAPRIVQAPQQVYGPPAYAVAQKVIQPAPVYGPPPQQLRVVAPRPVYGPPPAKFVQQVAVAPPPQLVQNYVSAPVALPPPPPAPVAVAAPVALTGKKQNPLTFAYSYDQGGAKVSHSYSGSGW